MNSVPQSMLLQNICYSSEFDFVEYKHFRVQRLLLFLALIMIFNHSINEIFARTWARGLEVTDRQDSVALMQIACTEPQYGGLAIFDAMAMINWDTCGYYEYNNERRSNFSSITLQEVGEKLSNTIKIYPNPTQSNLIVEFSNNIEIYSISVTYISGSQISCNFIEKDNQLLIETINLAKGFYIARLFDSQKNAYNLSFFKE